MNKLASWWILPFSFLLLSKLASASQLEAGVTGNPYLLMEHVAQQTFAQLAKVDREAEDAQQQLQDIVEQQLMPHVDYRYAAFVVMGQQIKKTNAEQRDRFAEGFRAYLVDTYIHALGQYDEQEVIVEPAKPLGEKSKISVRAQFIEQGRPPIDLSFKFRKLKKEPRWLAYDLVAEGVSLLSTKRSEFESLIRREGIEEVISLLENRQIEVDSES